MSRIALVALLGVAWTTAALAISDEEIFRDFPFNLVNPGARALGVGGAFISLADDSTAARANPAGLVNLRRPELFAELRGQRLDSSEVAISTRVDNVFFQGDLSVAAVSEPDGNFSPAFLSYVIPFKRVALAFSRTESLNIQTRTLNSFEIQGQEAVVEADIVTGKPRITGYQPVDFALTADADVDARITQYNTALAVDLHRRFSLGLTAVIGSADVNGRVDNMFVDRSPGSSFPEPTLDYATRIDDTDTDIGYNVGLLWRPADWASIGAVYRRGLRMVLEQQIGDQGVRSREARELFGATFENVIRTPNSYGLGLSFRPAEPWTILVDVVKVHYSDLMDSYVSGLNRISFPSDQEKFKVDDGVEQHIGIERILLKGTTPFALRFGAWSDPDHRIRADESSDLRAAFPPGERVTHYTAGFGMTLKQSVQIDFAADISSANSYFVFSSIYRF